MQLHQLKSVHKLGKKKRVGRGGKRGTYSGKGLKGQKSRAGHRFAPVIRELIKKHPKLRGYRQRSKKNKFLVNESKNQKSKVIIKLEKLEEEFKSGEKVNPKSLLERGLISKIKGRTPRVKILGKMTIKKKLIIEGCELSGTAKEKIEKAGGEVKRIKN